VIPWACDALLPVAERHASLKFRRFFKRFDATRIDYESACELVAFLDMVPMFWSCRIWHWTAIGKREVQRLVDHLRDSEDVARMVRENQLALDRETGVAILRALLDNGWERGKVPDACARAMLDMRAAGFSVPSIARSFGVSVDQARWIMGRNVTARAASAVASVGLIVG